MLQIKIELDKILTIFSSETHLLNFQLLKHADLWFQLDYERIHLSLMTKFLRLIQAFSNCWLSSQLLQRFDNIEP